MPILKKNSFNISRDNLLTLYGQIEEYLQMHQDGRSYLGETYKDAFKRVMNQDACGQVD